MVMKAAMFPLVSAYDASSPSRRKTAAADLDSTLLASSSAFLYYFIISFTGLRIHDTEAMARGVLPRHYVTEVRADTWEVFRTCGSERRVVVIVSPAIMVEPFVRDFLGAKVAGTELETFVGGHRFTGRIKAVLVDAKKREVIQKLFAGGDMLIHS